MKEEQLKLDEVVKEFEKLIEENHLRQDVVKKNYGHDIDTMVSNLNKLESREKILKMNIEKPYFARIDFVSDDLGIKEVCYIGKIGTMDSDNKIITVDWRTPIASLYYDSAIGDASYIAPEGKITGKLLVKRQYDIEKRKLISFQDVDSVSSDEILKPYLSTSIDARLKNIVSTIQKEQNEIIREEIDTDIIVQGVAGSGKTTVALHRIAYLVYQNKDTIDISQYLIIGPNKFFVHYISSVLPDLDVEGVGEFDLLEFTSNYLGETIKLNHKIDDSITKYKMTLEYKKVLDRYLDDLEEEIIPDCDLEMFGFPILTRSEILKLYKKASTDTYFFQDKVERTLMLLTKYINDRQSKLIIKANDYIDQLFTNEKDIKKLTTLSNQRELLKEEITNKCSHLLKKYFKVINEKTTSLYFKFLDRVTDYDSNPIWNEFSNPKKINYEDLASLLYIRYRIYGNSDYLHYRHVVVDEAQDYGEFVFDVFKLLMKNATFSVFGDLAQTIYEYRTIDNWDKVIQVGYSNNMKYLNKSYRTTIEIMTEANKINKYLNLNIADAVIRHGKEVVYQKLNHNLLEILNHLIAEEYQTIAIISKDKEESKKVYQELKNMGIDINLITDDSLDYNGGICSITSSLSKGLEFDAVIIYKADNDIFKKDDSFDMKLLYVSMTRALHELVVTYQNELVEIL